jgi:hypothetical protein
LWESQSKELVLALSKEKREKTGNFNWKREFSPKNHATGETL